MADNAYLRSKIAVIQGQLDAYEEAALALASGRVQSQSLDTGQTVQTFTMMDVQKLQEMIDVLYNRYVMLCARLDGSNTSIARPAY